MSDDHNNDDHNENDEKIGDAMLGGLSNKPEAEAGVCDWTVQAIRSVLSRL
jgi:hypothetical protein